MPLDCTSDGTWLSSNPSPATPSPALSPSFSPPPTQAPGSSFKPLRLASHPWVRAHLRAESRAPDKPRLSLLALYYHMHGPNSFSQSNVSHATSPGPAPGTGADLRASPDSLLETMSSPIINGARLLAGRSTGSSSARASPSSQATAYSRHCASGTMTLVPISVLPPFPHDAVRRRTPAVQLPVPSSPGEACAPVPAGPTSTLVSSSPCQFSPNKPRKQCQKQTYAAPLSVAAFPAAFCTLSSEDFFGHCEPEERGEKRMEKRELE